MKNTRALLITIVVLVLVLAGAYVLYDRLSTGKGQNLETLPVLGSLPVSTVPVTTEKDDTVPAVNTTEAPAVQTTPAATEPQTDETSEPMTEQTSEPVAEQTSEPTSKEDRTIPDFTVYNSFGEEVHLRDFFGKPIILNFWASWCGPCRQEMPELQAAFEEYGEEIHFVLINLTDGSSETQSSAEDFLTANGYTFPVYFDLKQDAAGTYGVYSIPATYFIGADGVGVARALGSMNAETLQRGIDMIYSRDVPNTAP